MGKWVLNKTYPIGIDLRKKDIYGKSGTFKVVIGSPKHGGVPEVFENVMNELIEPVDELTSKANADISKGDTKIPVDDASGWKVGYVAKAGDVYFYVERVDTDNNILYARNPLEGDIADGTDINRVGNTGIYEMSYTPTHLAKHLIIISNPSIGLYNTAKTVDVVEYDESDIYNKLTDLETKLDEKDLITGEILV